MNNSSFPTLERTPPQPLIDKFIFPSFPMFLGFSGPCMLILIPNLLC